MQKNVWILYSKKYPPNMLYKHCITLTNKHRQLKAFRYKMHTFYFQEKSQSYYNLINVFKYYL